MIDSIEKDCVGCGVCAAVCAARAVRMVYNANGFYVPEVQRDKCLNCGKCVKSCVALDYNRASCGSPLVYAAAASDEECLRSTSGGVFALLAKYVLEQGGYVCGVAWSDAWEAEHVIIHDIAELSRLRFSKYVQSRTAGVWESIKNLLKAGNLVLFSGTACQNAALLKYLGKKPDNLITVDIFCWGVPSPKVWKEYLEQNFCLEDIEEICFRGKGGDWSRGSTSRDIRCSYVQEKGCRKPIGMYYEAFLQRMLFNDSCLDCKFREVPRPADFSIGDFWSWRDYVGDVDPRNGISAMVLNSPKARELVSEMEDQFHLLREVDIRGQWETFSLRRVSNANEGQRRFYELYRSGRKLNSILNELVLHRYDVLLAATLAELDYGRSLSLYATCHLLKKLNVSVLVVCKTHDKKRLAERELTMLRFLRESCGPVLLRDNSENDSELNELGDAVVIPPGVERTAAPYSWLEWAHSEKNKIAFCVSFGRDYLTNDEVSNLRFLVHRLNHISCSDVRGGRIFREELGCSVEHVMEPFLLADRGLFDALTPPSEPEDSGYIAVYMESISLAEKEDLERLSKQKKSRLVYVAGVGQNTCSVEEFVSMIKRADVLITDDFYSSCLAVLYRVPFVAKVTEKSSYARWEVFRKWGGASRLVSNMKNIADVALRTTSLDISITAAQRENAEQWLRDALNAPPTQPSKSEEAVDYLLDQLRAASVNSYTRDKNEAARATRRGYRYYLKKTLINLIPISSWRRNMRKQHLKK